MSVAPQTPPSGAEVEDELPSLEADVPVFPPLDSFGIEPARTLPTREDRPERKRGTGILSEIAVGASLIDPQLLRQEDFSIIEWYQAGGEINPATPALEQLFPTTLELTEPSAPVVESLIVESPPDPKVAHLPLWLDLEEQTQPPTLGEPENPPLALEAVAPPALPDWLDLAEPQAISLPPETASPPVLSHSPALKEPESAAPTLAETISPLVLPSWLTLAEPEPSPLTSAAEVQQVLPDWLLLEEPERDRAAPKAAAPAALPDWLFLSERSQTTERILPEWLFAAEAARPESTLPALFRELPDWLDIAESIPVLAQQKLQLPDWLDMAELPALSIPVAAMQDGSSATMLAAPKADQALGDESPATTASPRELPAWLFADEGAMPLPTVHTSLPSWLFIEEPSLATEAPALVGETIPATGPPIAVVEVAEPPISEPTAHTDPVPARPKVEEAADTLLLPGIVLARPLQTSGLPSRRPAAPAQAPDYGAIFAEFLQPQAEPTVVAQVRSFPRYRLLSLLLVVVVVIPLMTRPWINIQARPETSGLYKIIQDLPSTANVVVAFDWNAGMNDEMAPIAGAIVDHLVRKKVKIVAVSLVPEGAKLAQSTLDRHVLPKANGYIYGERVVNLGYLPGDEVAIQGMATSFADFYHTDYRGLATKDLAILKEVKSMKNADLVIDLAGDPQMLRMWVTQLSQRYPGVRMIAGISAAALPWTQPFVSGSRESRPPQLKGMVTGIRGAAEYELLGNDPNDHKTKLALASLDAQSLASVLIVLVIVFGNLVFLRRELAESRQAKKAQSSAQRS